jgi:hypothetical protein
MPGLVPGIHVFALKAWPVGVPSGCNSDGGSFRIEQKRVDLINCDSAFEAILVPI